MSTTVTRTTYPRALDAAVELYTLEGGGHTWPGGDPTLVPTAITGPADPTIDTSQIIWDFFAAHSHPGPIPT
ncbi:hypothetical protein LTT66_32560 [Nocardia gipuzkoensis]|uniref:hypothetical protein n=1 Tax=Nocardia gipuzkoensis TaxID=2749991 RepID=UPI001E329926|nr:hypothetical protein [Nocardia gipuzkoensis]UGT67860.1 hypothetical protein LTT66_32560 [Nocardia gipuzkoensis]